MSPAQAGIAMGLFWGLLAGAAFVRDRWVEPWLARRQEERTQRELAELAQLNRDITEALQYRQYSQQDGDFRQFKYWSGRLDRLMGLK